MWRLFLKYHTRNGIFMPQFLNALRLAALAALSWSTGAGAATSTTLPDTLAQRVAACTACHAPKERGDAFFEGALARAHRDGDGEFEELHAAPPSTRRATRKRRGSGG